MKFRAGKSLRALGSRLTLVVAGFAAYSTSGCLSNEYRITKDELTRVVQLPPSARGEKVRVLQQLGERRGEPVPPGGPRPVYVGAPLSEPPPPVVVETEPSVYVEGNIDLPLYQPAHVSRPAPAPSVVRAPGHWRNPGAGGGGSGGGGNLGGVGKAAGSLGKGGGGGKGEEVAVLAVVVAVVALFAVVGLAASEGARFDGEVQMRPEQPVHLKNARGQELHVPLAALTVEDVALATEATVSDDEGFGLRLLDRRPLDRVGATFKVTAGALMESGPTPDHEGVSGMASTIQVGGFVNRRLGFLGSLQLGGGSDSAGRTFQRHGLGAEVQAFPLLAGPLALGAFGHAGVAMAGNSQTGLLNGPVLGGGLLLELALSTRLAFALRGDWSAQNIDGWSNHGTITAGLAIY
jgi:hypothetical protein